MELIPRNCILEFRLDQLKCVRQQYNLDKPGDMSQAIDVLEEWVKAQKHFTKKKFPRNYLERAIIISKGSLERTKNKLDKICTFRSVMPNFFGDNLTKNKFDDIEIFPNALLPKPTNEYYRIYILRNIGKTFTSDQFLNIYRYLILICEYIMAHDYSDGFIIIVDYIETNLLEMIKALNLTELRQIATIVTEGIGMRIKGIHLITPSRAIDTLVTIFKQLLSPKLGNRIFVHKDVSAVYQHVPKDLLPKDYGGKEKTLLELGDDLRKEITNKEFINYIEDMNEAKTDESCRQTDKFNEHYLGMPGSFRTLNVD